MRHLSSPPRVILSLCIFALLLFAIGLFGIHKQRRAIQSLPAVNMEDLDGYGLGNTLSSTSSSSASSFPLSIIRPQISELGSGVYPTFRSLLSCVQEWHPDQPDAPSTFRETLMHFNYSDPMERAMAEKYRNAELPFKLYDVRELDEVAQIKWTEEYLHKHMKNTKPHVEQSDSNHFMYWSIKSKEQNQGYSPPTELIDLTFEQWHELAKRADEAKIDSNAKHFYFMAGTIGKDKTSFLAKDLDIFSTKQENFFITNVEANKGIQCRFGMRGIIAEAHYDSGRNMVAMLKGAKRYILTPPDSCKSLGIISDENHPSFRHSVIDWSDMQQAQSHGFDKIDAIDTILGEGQVLYIPSYWFHYIVSLKYSIQCNSRSGSPPRGEGKKAIDDCIGPRTKKKKNKKKKNRPPPSSVVSPPTTILT